MKQNVYLALILSMTICSLSALAQTAGGAGAACKVVLGAGGPSQNDPALLAYRTSTTNPSAKGFIANTTADREKFIQDTTAIMIDYLNGRIKTAWGGPDTPEMVFVAATGVNVEVPNVAIANPSKNPVPLTFLEGSQSKAYHYEEVPKLKVSGLGSDGILSGTLLLPVSAHTGIANATKWSKTDTYSIYLSTGGKVVATLAKKVKSLDFITNQEVTMKLQPGIEYQVSYHRSGSGGPGGFAEGRLLDLVWDGK